MSGSTWLYADPHFYHNNIVKFTRVDENANVLPLRPWDDAVEMTEDMIKWYNEIVDDADRVYILGDVAFSKQNIWKSVSRLKGRKCLIPGNHDPVKIKTYIDLFDDVRGYVQRNGFIMSHIPIHPESLGRWKVNIHGHLHKNEVRFENSLKPDPRYICVSVEHTNFRPILLDEVLRKVGLVNEQVHKT